MKHYFLRGERYKVRPDGVVEIRQADNKWIVSRKFTSEMGLLEEGADEVDATIVAWEDAGPWFHTGIYEEIETRKRAFVAGFNAAKSQGREVIPKYGQI